MKKLKFILCVLLVAFLYATSVPALTDSRLLRNPDINGDRIVFVYGGDLWTVSAKGGDAVRLTSHPGSESNPYFSPDGKMVAFSAEYDGNLDVFVVPAGGGEPKRLTWHPGPDSVIGWSQDGKNILFSSPRESYSRFAKIFQVSIDGSHPQALPLPMGYTGSYSADGKYIAYTPLPFPFTSWRRYRGGEAPYIWVFSFSDKSVKKIPHPDCNDTYPRWVGDEIYFLSDRDRVMNLYSYNVKNGNVKQMTAFKGADIKTYGVDKGKIVFEREGYLHLFDPVSGKTDKLTINIPTEALNTRPHFTKAGRLIYNAGISPTGQRALFEARGEILTVPAKKGDIRNLTNTPGAAERESAWSPDGKSIAYFGEVDGEYALQIVDQKGEGKPKVIRFEKPGYYFNLRWAPDSKKLAFNDQAQNLYYLEADKGKPVLIDTEAEFLSQPVASWSPDSRWIAYPRTGKNRMGDIYLYSLETGKSHRITDGMSYAANPVFDRNGKYLYFAASTDTAFDLAWLDMSEYPHQPTAGLYLVILAKEEPSPFKPESDEEKPAEDEEKKDGKDKDKDKEKDKGKDAKEEKPIKIDLDGIGQRIVPIDVPVKTYLSIQAGEEGLLHYLEFNREKNNFDLHVYKIKDRKDEVILTGINGYWLSADGKKMLYQKDNFTYTIADAGKKPDPSSENRLNTEAMETYCVPAQEWLQMLFEAWRINRDMFYDPGMHGQDWPAIWKQYEAYLPYVAHRSDLNYLIAQLIGELAIGHAYVGGGDYPEINRVSGGLLGADYEVVDGYYRIKKIYKGENWNPSLRAPLMEPGMEVKEGDYILEVNGKLLKSPASIYSFFEKSAGKQVVIKVNSKSTLEGAKTFTVVPIDSDINLRHREWIENNRKKVEELSGGKVGYVYLPNTSVAGYNNFIRYYYAHLDKEGMVMDERFNGGGYAADFIIDMLNRPLMSWWLPRYGREVSTPMASIFGPKVMIINEYAGSGGDAMPHYFRLRGIGKLVGKRTWGGLVGISGYPRLMDGGFVTAPSFSIVGLDGKFIIENHGVDPDVEVEYTPADYIAGKDPQLETAVSIVLEELKKNPPPMFKHDPYPRGR